MQSILLGRMIPLQHIHYVLGSWSLYRVWYFSRKKLEPKLSHCLQWSHAARLQRLMLKAA